mmetsp:Transcript_22716/g.37562  ORF Transcript_22716/g.37562 Transcript_22716/m.37562 type:complete len:710 (+) Transcript_22716:40-2169(+)
MKDSPWLVCLALLQPVAGLRPTHQLIRQRQLSHAVYTGSFDRPPSSLLICSKATRSCPVSCAPDDRPDSKAEPSGLTLQERLRVFWRLAIPYFKNAEGAKLNFGLLLVLTLCSSGISVIFSYVGRDFYSALSSKDQALFYEKTANFALGLAVATPLSVLYKFQRQRLALNWRQWMTAELARQYYTDQAYYKVELDPEIDNPDQRITEDVNAFTKVSLDFFITLMTSAIDLVSFSGILYSIYPDLFYAIFLYAGFGSFTTIQLGRALVGQNAEQLLREADLRYALVRLRENAESIAFYRGEAQEESEVQARLERAVENKRAILGTQRNLEFFTVGYSYLIQILPVLVVAPLYFAGSVELGVITQSTGAFNHVLNDLSIIVNQFEGISSFSAGLARLSTFVERMETYGSNASTNATFQITNNEASAKADEVDASVAVLDRSSVRVSAVTDDECNTDAEVEVWGGHCIERVVNTEVAEMSVALQVHQLSLLTPDGARELFANVSLEVTPGQHLLIVGNSGAGKSSMLRAVAGLWDRGSGEISRPLTSDSMFLPQRPYCTLGSLRQQLIYPLTEESAGERNDEMLLEALRTVQLARLAERGAAGLDEVRDWGDQLSLGEQQRLAFARVLIKKPKLAILDEATSALDLDNEAMMYTALAAVPDITYISVGHRPSLLRFHHSRLRLYGADRSPSFIMERIERESLVEQLETSLIL